MNIIKYHKLTFWWWHIEISNYNNKKKMLSRSRSKAISDLGLGYSFDCVYIYIKNTQAITSVTFPWNINKQGNHCQNHNITYLHPRWKFRPYETQANASEHRVLTSSYSTSAYYWNQRRNPTQLWVLGWVWTVHTFLVAFLSSALGKWGRHTPK